MTRDIVTRRTRIAVGASLLLLASVPVSGAAQQPLLGAGGLSIAPTAQALQFTTPVRQDSLLIRGVQQVVLPLTVRGTLPGSWNVEIAGGYTQARIETGPASAPTQLELRGPTDTRVRIYGPLLRDVLQLNAAVNVPTGLVNLDAEQFAVLRTVAAPALAMPAPVLGGGLGGTVGLSGAYRRGDWAFGGGLSHEVRTRFTPVEAALVGSVSNATLTPAAVTRSSVAATRILGRQQLSVVAGLDSYGSDLVEATISNRRQSVSYRLGATRSIAGIWHVTNVLVRSIDVTGSLRQRAAFTDGRGQLAEGSDGTYGDLSVRLGVGHPRRAGVDIIGELRRQSGLDIDPTIATAGVDAIGGGAVLRVPAGTVLWRIAARAEQGTLHTGLQRAPFRAASLTISVGPRNR